MGASTAAQLLPVTFSLDTSIYADGDLLADTQEIPNAVFAKGRAAELRSITLLDEDDQGIALDFLILGASTSLGTENAAFAPTDVMMRECLFHTRFATGDYLDCGGSRIAHKSNIGHMLEAGASTRSLYVALVTRGGTPTYTAAGIRASLGLVWH